MTPGGLRTTFGVYEIAFGKVVIRLGGVVIVFGVFVSVFGKTGNVPAHIETIIKT